MHLRRRISGVIQPSGSQSDIEPAFATLVQQGAGALVVSGNPLFLTTSDQLVALATRHRMPSIYQYRDTTLGGGLISYGTSLSDAYRLVGSYTGRILKGEKPAELPVQQATKVELVINLKTAKALGLSIPETLLATADQVIE